MKKKNMRRHRVKIDGVWYALLPWTRVVHVKQSKRRPLTAEQKRVQLERRAIYRKIEHAHVAAHKAEVQWARKIVTLSDLHAALSRRSGAVGRHNG